MPTPPVLPVPPVRRQPRLLTAVTAIVGAAVVGAVVVTLPGCSGEPARRPSGATAASSGGRTSSQPLPRTPSLPSTVPPTVPGTGTVEPSVAISTMPPVTIGQPATIAPGITVTVGGLSTLTMTAQAPGETSGPAVSFAVQVRNTSAQPVDIWGVAVTVSYGKGVPASPITSAPYAPLAGSLSAGESAQGTYVFRVPTAAIGTVRIEVASDFTAGIAVFIR